MKKYRKYILLAVVLIILPLLMITIFGSTDKEAKAIVAEPVPQEKPAESITRKKEILPENPHLVSLLSEYEQTIKKIMKRTGIPGAAVAIVKDTSIIYMKGFGLKTLGTSDSVDVNTVFRLGSVSKCFASVLTGIMAHEGVVSWQDPVIQYLPDFALKSEENTELLNLEHVLSHTTGLPYHTYTNWIEEGTDLPTLLHQLRDVNLIGKPGKVYAYQNVAYSIIGEVLHSATGKPYNDLMEEKVFGPLGMANASLTYEEIMENGNVAKPHLTRRRKWRTVPITSKYYNAAPAGGINASITDMAQWLNALLGNRPDVVTTETLEKIYTPFVDARSKNRSYRRVGRIKDAHYGLGWRIINFTDNTLVYHGGYVNGYRSEVALDYQDKIAICILTNAPGDVADEGIPEFLKLYNSKKDSIRMWQNQRYPLLAYLHEEHIDKSFVQSQN